MCYCKITALPRSFPSIIKPQSCYFCLCFRYVPTWPRQYQSRPLEIVGGTTTVPVVNDDAFFPDGTYQGEILLGTYQQPHTPISPYAQPPSPFMQPTMAHPPTYDSIRYESRSYEASHSQHYDSVHPDEHYY